MNRTVLVMMGTYNGIRFLQPQIETIRNQSHVSVDLLFSDDGSNDGTTDYLAEVAATWQNGKVRLASGPQNGFCENYRQMLITAPRGRHAYAFADQDDLWHEDKLERALKVIDSYDAETPVLYCTRTRIVDNKGKAIGFSPLFSRPPSFRNALVQSLAGGNTMVMNAKAHELVAEASRRTGFVVHDWWSYQIVSGAGGTVIYDPEPSLDYRQHGGNLIGANSSLQARMHRFKLMSNGRFKQWNATNSQALAQCRDLLTNEARQDLATFDALREEKSATRRLAALRSAGFYRQTAFGQASLYAACILGQI